MNVWSHSDDCKKDIGKQVEWDYDVPAAMQCNLYLHYIAAKDTYKIYMQMVKRGP